MVSTAVGLVFALPHLADPATRRQYLLSCLAEWWSWGLITPLIIAADNRFPLPQRGVQGWLPPRILMGLVATLVYINLFATLKASLGIESWSQVRPDRVLTDALDGLFLWSLVVYCLIVGVVNAYRYQSRYLSAELRMERLERSFSEARLNALRMQLDPHFLFNALNTISAQVARDPRLARTMIEHLGTLLRLTLDSRNRQEIPLWEELALLDHYLAIQKIRFGDRLRIEMSIPPELRYAVVPSLFLQPLVENAIRHGLSPRAGGGTIVVTAASSNGRLEIKVTDDGVGLPPGWSLRSQEGIGLSVTRERISGLHPDGHSSFTVAPRAGSKGTEVDISFPLHLMEEERDHAQA
jgi:two-component system, LytTR family, sensor kinase